MRCGFEALALAAPKAGLGSLCRVYASGRRNRLDHPYRLVGTREAAARCGLGRSNFLLIRR